MSLPIIFLFSGLVISSILLAKKIEIKYKRTFLLLRAITRGDERVRDYSHRFAHFYSESKEKAHLLVSRRLPLHSKKLLSKANTKVQDLSSIYLEKIRGIKALKRTDDGISDFFKNLSNKELGRNETASEGSQNLEEVVE